MGYKDPEEMRRLYVEERRGMDDIAEELDCSPNTVQRWLEKHGIEARGRAEAIRRKPAPMSTDKYGYETWRTKAGGRYHRVRVHRLLAVAEFGFEAVRDKHTHHKNGIRFDNRPGNIEAVSPGEHRDRHRKWRSLANE